MFNLSSNFFSAVCVGNFNPGILSIDFIKEKCNYTFEGHPIEEPSPVVTKITDDKMSIFVDFSKFQVLRNEYDTNSAKKTLELALNYLKILEYTPIRAFGVNFQYTVSSFIQEIIDDNFYNHIKNVGLKFYSPIELIATKVYTKDSMKKLRGLDLRLENYLDFRCNVNLNNLDSNLILNINIELNNLEKQRSNIDNIVNKFDDVISIRDKFITEIFDNYVQK